MYTNQKEEMQTAIARIDSSITEGEKKLQELDEFKTKVCDSHISVAKQIDEHFELCLKQLHQHKNELKEQLENVRDAKLAQVDQKLMRVRREVDAARQSHQSTVDTMDNSSEYEYVTQHNALTDQLFEVQEHTIPLGLTPSAGACFRPNRCEGHVGSIIPTRPGRPRAIKFIQALDGFEGALHVTTSPAGLLAVCDFDGKKVIIYHKVNGLYEKKMCLKLDPSNSFAPLSVAIHPDGRFLVARQSCVEVFSADGNYQTKIETSSTVEEGTAMNICSILCTADGRMLVGDLARSVITEHDPTGMLVRTIQTNIQPVYMTLIHNCQIAMSDFKIGKVSVLDMETEQEILSLNVVKAKGLCYDAETESLLVAKSKSGILEQYSMNTGTLVAYVACLEKGLHTPCGMSMADDDKCLIVANYKSVNVYQASDCRSTLVPDRN